MPLPQSGAGWHTARGRLGIWLPSPSLLVVGLQEHGEAEFAQPIIDAYERLSAKGSIHLFFDTETMTSYDSPLRTELTARFVPDRKRIASFYVLVQSKLVTMGIGVANIALGGIVHATADRAQFKARLGAVLFQQRILGFSSDVLDALAVTPA